MSLCYCKRGRYPHEYDDDNCEYDEPAVEPDEFAEPYGFEFTTGKEK